VLYVLNLEMLVPWGPGERGLQVHADLHRSAFNCTVVYTIDIGIYMYGVITLISSDTEPCAANGRRLDPSIV
jgi:hypothetical protein